ncbi:MAG: hypothetical protein K6G03_07925 [Lachnospiraceae bacterium]|nr:hypothetical protein [Lachnospiraceae bacterium]
MYAIWNIVGSLRLKNAVKKKLFVLIMVFINILAGALVWYLAGRIFLPQTEWLLCFMGYPAFFIGFFGGNIFLYNQGS